GRPSGVRFPGPVGAEQPVQLTFADPQVEPGEHQGAAEAPVHALQLHRRRGRLPIHRGTPLGVPRPLRGRFTGAPPWGSPDPSVAELIADALNQNTGAGRDGRAWSGDPAARYNLAMTGIRAPAARTRAREEAVLAALAAGVVGPAVDPAVPGRMLGILDGTANRGARQRLRGVRR